MKIKKFIKKNNSTYNIILEDDQCLNIYEDLILKYDLLISKELNSYLITVLKKENIEYMAYYTVLKHLKRMPHTSFEIYKYLLKKNFSKEICDQTIEKITKEGYLNDKKYVDSFLNLKLKISLDGPYKIKRTLLLKGVSEAIIDEELKKYSIEEEQIKIAKIIDKALKSNHNKSIAYLKNSIKFHLINEGFNKELINKNLSNIVNHDDELIIQKEYNKQKIKLSRLYKDEELELQIRKKMYAKGFYNIE